MQIMLELTNRFLIFAVEKEQLECFLRFQYCKPFICRNFISQIENCCHFLGYLILQIGCFTVNVNIKFEFLWVFNL